jgi:O-antigen/teichoic acid export membrane protein
MILGFVNVIAGNILRLASGMLVFVLLARWLGPQSFGAFTYALALATLAVVPVNFGLSTYVLRSFGAEPERKREFMSVALAAKCLLAAGVLVVSAVALAWLPRPMTWIFMPLLLAQLAESFSELHMLSFRAAGRYGAEAANASLTSVVHIALMLLTATWSTSVVVIAWAFFASRLFGLALTAWRGAKAFGAIPVGPWIEGVRVLRRAWAYALELGLSTLYLQLDALMIQAALGLHDLGLYQAGMKLVQGFSRLAPILALYVLPRLSAGTPVGRSGSRQTGLTLALFAVVGLVSGGVLAFEAPLITRLLFGPAYADLAQLLPLFGCLLFLRFMETGAGLVLVAAGLQSRKVWLVGVQVLLMLGIGWVALTRGGLSAWLLTSVACTLLLLLLYGLLWWRSAGLKGDEA